MSDQKIKISLKKYPDDPFNMVINALRSENFEVRTVSISLEDAKKIQAIFKDVVYINGGKSKFWEGIKLRFFHIEGLTITDIETPEHYGFDEDTLYILYPEGSSLLEDPFVDFIELKEGDLENIKEQLKEMNRYDILLKLEI